MRIDYDTEAQALDIAFADVSVAQTIEIDSGTLVDVAADGTVGGIEVINPGRSWPLHEILERFEIDPDASAMLEALWPQGGAQFAFAQPTAAVA